MAITTQNTSSSGNKNNVNTTYSWQHVTHADTDCLVVMAIGFDGTAGDADITGVTYDGTAMTEAEQYYDAAVDYNVSVWYLTETAYGGNLGGVTANVQVTHGGKCSSACGFGIDLVGVDQADPVQDTQSETDAANANGSITVAGAVADSMTVGGMGSSEGDPANTSVTTGTQIGETDQGGTVAGSAYIADTGTLTWNDSAGAVDWVMAAVNFNATAGPITINMSVAVATSAAPDVDAQPGTVTISMAAATMTSAAPDVTPSASGPQTVNMGAAVATSSAPVLDAQPGTVTVSMAVAASTSAAPDVDAQPGAVIVTMAAATSTSSAPDVTPNAGGGPQTVNMGAAAVTSAAPTLDAQPGARAISMSAAATTSNAPDVDAQGGAVVVSINAAAMTSAAPDADPQPGGVTVTMGAAASISDAPDLDAQPGAIVVLMGAASMASAAPDAAPSAGGGVTVNMGAIGLICGVLACSASSDRWRNRFCRLEDEPYRTHAGGCQTRPKRPK